MHVVQRPKRPKAVNPSPAEVAGEKGIDEGAASLSEIPQDRSRVSRSYEPRHRGEALPAVGLRVGNLGLPLGGFKIGFSVEGIFLRAPDKPTGLILDAWQIYPERVGSAHVAI